jgi:hypothetical protein
MFVPFVVLLSACQALGSRNPVTPGPPETVTQAPLETAPNVAETAMESAPPSGAHETCVLVCGNAAAARLDLPKLEVHVDEAENADAVFASMHGDLLACYKARVAEYANAHASLLVDFVVAPDGSVRTVEATGGALFGDRTMRCITRRIQRASFAPVRGGGTLHVQIPLTFSLAPAGDSI